MAWVELLIGANCIELHTCVECPTKVISKYATQTEVYRLFWRRVTLIRTLEEFDNTPIGVRDACRATIYEKSI